MTKDRSAFAGTQCVVRRGSLAQRFCIARDDSGTIWVSGALVTSVQGAVQLSVAQSWHKPPQPSTIW